MLIFPRLFNIGSGELRFGLFIILIGKGCEENIHHIQLGHARGHGTAAEKRFICGDIKPVIRQLEDR